MKPWQPDRRQWRVIWIIYAVAFLFSVDWQYFDPPMDAGLIMEFVVIAGLLVMWRLQGQRKRK